MTEPSIMLVDDEVSFVEITAKRLAKRNINVITAFNAEEGLAKLADIKSVIERKERSVEIILTGQGATVELIEMADLVTEMKKVKHPFDIGIAARRGIEF